MIEMIHYVSTNKDGIIEVQNVVMGMFGQKHTHTKKGFGKWKKDIDEKYIVYL